MSRYDIRKDHSLRAPHPERIPLPVLFTMQQDKSHEWSTLYPAWNLFYYCCLGSLKRERYNVLIETGTNRGCGTVLMAQTLRETGIRGHVWTFELSDERADSAQKLVDGLELDGWVTIVRGNSLANIPEAIASMPVDFAFIDSDHSTGHCIKETELLLPNVIEGEGKFYFDNTNCGPVDAALCDLKKRHGTSGWVDFPNVSRIPPGQAIWQPWQRTEPLEWFDSKKE